MLIRLTLAVYPLRGQVTARRAWPKPGRVAGSPHGSSGCGNPVPCAAAGPSCTMRDSWKDWFTNGLNPC